MHTCTRLQDLATLDGPLHLALGVFDGVHVGHQAVIARAVRAAAARGGVAGLLTFDPHPIQVMAPAKAPTHLLATLEHKARIVKELGVDLLVPLHFDMDLAQLEAEEFIGQLLESRVATLAVGEDWRFGHKRQGDVALLKSLADAKGFQLEAVAPVMFEGDRISSTRIRQAIQDGNLEAAAAMLGRPYSMKGEVMRGRQLGRDLGFPTANLEVGRRQCPPYGVWAVRVDIDGSRDWRPAVANLGIRPTVEGGPALLEVHLLDFDGDLYGVSLEVRFEHHIRSEKAFDSLEQLGRQIAADVDIARKLLED